ncbi:MAG: sensor histidine kinase [Chitinivibrionales bacterium]
MQDLLELGKPMDRENVLQVPIAKLCATTIELWEKSSKTKHTIQFEDTDNVGELEILMDENKLQQVLIHLLENASQNSPEQSTISLQLHRVDQNDVVIRVVDRGAGIPAEHIHDLFEPFFTTRRQGTGLGLSIVKHIVTTHGGTINAYNNADSPGSTFEISFPMKTEIFPE